MRSPSLTKSPPSSPNPNPLILTSLTLIVTFFISKRTRNNSSSLLKNLYTKTQRKAKLKMKINNILLDGLCLGFSW